MSYVYTWTDAHEPEHRHDGGCTWAGCGPWPEPEPDPVTETAEILTDPETMAAICEAEAERGPVSPELAQAVDDAWDATLPDTLRELREPG